VLKHPKMLRVIQCVWLLQQVFLALFTVVLAGSSVRTLKQIQKDREVDLLRKRLENLYSMLRFNRQILEMYNLSPRAGSLSQRESDFYRKVRANLYLGSDDLVVKAEKILEIIDGGGTLGGRRVEDDELKKIKKNLIDQTDLDYEKYMERLIELTKKPKQWWNIRVRILRKS
jgi:hypothetical protein